MIKHLESFMNRFRSANLKIIGVQVDKSLKKGEAVLLVNEAFKEKAESFVNALGRIPVDVDLFNEQVECMENIAAQKEGVIMLHEYAKRMVKEIDDIREQVKQLKDAAIAEESGGRAETGEGRK